MEKTVNLQTSAISEIARLNSATIQVFRKYGIDFYNKGANSLSEACTVYNCDESIVSKELKSALSTNVDKDFDDWSLEALIAHIIESHHQYVNITVPEISAMFKTVLESRETNNIDLKRISELFRQLGNDMKQHMQKEELALFPLIRNLELSKTIGQKEPTGLSVKSLITVVEYEHDTSGIIIKQINRLCNNYSAPEDASPVFCSFFNKLNEFEADLVMHIHLENNVLHKKAIELEQELQG
jgi:regulator of cell morphogenesis and NO signaling